MNPGSAYGLAAHALLLGALASLLPTGARRQQIALATTAIAMIGIAPGLHGAFGAPSFTLLQLALLQLSRRRPGLLDWRVAAAIVGTALVVYPLALGLGPVDPYALGYRPLPLLAALLPLGAVLAWRRQEVWLLLLAGDCLAYALGIFGNLWDALLDPLLVLLAGYVLLRHRWTRRPERQETFGL